MRPNSVQQRYALRKALCEVQIEANPSNERTSNFFDEIGDEDDDSDDSEDDDDGESDGDAVPASIGSPRDVDSWAATRGLVQAHAATSRSPQAWRLPEPPAPVTPAGWVGGTFSVLVNGRREEATCLMHMTGGTYMMRAKDRNGNAIAQLPVDLDKAMRSRECWLIRKAPDAREPSLFDPL